MQAVVNSNILTQDTISEKLDYLLSDVDNSTKNDVENTIVAMGAKVVNVLVEKLRTLKGLQRGIVAMSLIRIGESSRAPLMALATESNEHQWMADYLLSEI
ncbi:MAG: hypothetical protein IKU37_00045 [Candidatus Gastranaerophilales bacterium]|nr:hypothetical protein [Candidatus Gastranaerophilales bacterium]